MNRWTILLMVATLANACDACDADVVYLRGGGSLSGSVKSLEMGKQKVIVVDTGNGIQISLTQGEVARVDRENDLIAQYQAHRATAGEDADAHWELARWCKANSLLPQYDRQVRHVIRLNPQHPTARASLGYTSVNGKWVLHDELQRAHGLVRHLGKWKVPADVEMTEAEAELEIQQKQWIQTVKRLRGRVLKGGKAADESLVELTAIEDPLASGAIGKLLVQREDPDSLRMLWVKLLSKWETAEAADALIMASLFDPEPMIREACLDRLEQFAKTRAVNTYIAMLRDNDNKKVRIAANALMAMKDPRSILPLTDALVTTHKSKTGGGPSMSSSFDRNGGGGGGFSFGGGKEKIIEQKVRNPPVLSALMTLAPDADYQYDAERWRQHFSRQMAEVSYDLRRDL
ncbi:HEAT repeat domain-containing protein [Rosistilla oblonga]|uniref:HEAT repeat domain-containing protein n=1 Tax=Rosistilla oblonga TaxID=2527990 RepID=UPI003A981211